MVRTSLIPHRSAKYKLARGARPEGRGPGRTYTLPGREINTAGETADPPENAILSSCDMPQRSSKSSFSYARSARRAAGVPSRPPSVVRGRRAKSRARRLTRPSAGDRCLPGCLAAPRPAREPSLYSDPHADSDQEH